MATGKFLAMAGAAMVAVTGLAEAREIKVGFIAPKSGGLAQLGDQLEKGARLYLKLHAKELGGDTIKLIVRDSKRPGGPIAKAAAQELITREKVEILTGVIFSPNAMSNCAAGDGRQGAVRGHERGHVVDYKTVAQYCPGVLHHVAGWLHHG